ncbi:MAG: GAF domain-containing protein [Anaerolineales bacterium]
MNQVKDFFQRIKNRKEFQASWLLDLSNFSLEERHKARTLLFFGLIITTIGSVFLLTQIYQTLHPDITPAPLIDFISDSIAIFAGVFTVYLLKKKRLFGASLLILSCLFLISFIMLYFGPQPHRNVGGVLSLLLIITLATILLKPQQAWLTFFIASALYFVINFDQQDQSIELLIPREPVSQLIFSLMTWIVGGGIITFIVYSTNYTLRKQAQRLRDQLQDLRLEEKKRKASEKRYRSIFEGVQDAILVENDQGEILDVNQRACEMFGYSYEVFLTKKVPDIVSEKGIIIHSQDLAKNNGTIEHIESINKRSNGEQFPVEFSAQLQDIGDQEVMVFVMRDITERKKAERAIQRQLKELSAIQRVAETGTKEISEDKIIEVTTQVLEDILATDMHGILLLDEEKKEFIVHSSHRNVPPEYQSSRIPIGKGIISEVYRTGETQYYPDVREIPHYMEIVPEIRSELCVPIKLKDSFLGVFNIESTELDAYDQDDKRFLLTLAGQLGTSIERARLFETTQKQLNRLRSLRNIDTAIISSFDLHVSLNIILSHITSQLELDAACIFLVDHPTQSLGFVAGKGFQTHQIQDDYLRLGRGLAGKVALSHSPVHIPVLGNEKEGLERPFLTEKEHFTFYYGLPLKSKGKPIGVLEMFHRTQKPVSKDWESFAETLSGQAAIAIDNALLFEELQQSNMEITQAYDTTLEGWAKALELRDHDTEGHSRRVTDLTIKLANMLGVPKKELPHIRRGALLHDIGKMAIPDEILRKKDSLSDKEWEIIKKHPLYAKEMLESVQYLEEALDIPLYHHERWDGSGYPYGWKGKEIPLPARIFAVVDVWDALTSDRPYRPAWSEKRALDHIKKQSGKHFDPQVVNAFLNLNEFKD